MTKKLEQLIKQLVKAGDPFVANEYLDQRCTKRLRTVKVVFAAAFVLHAIAQVEHPLLIDYKRKLIQKLNKQFKNNSVNYWQRGSKEEYGQPLPDDIDDTAVVATALLKTSEKPSPQTLIKLTTAEHKVGGPYYTWYVFGSDTKRWQDIDPVVNAHILYWSAAAGVRLPQLRSYISKAIKQQKTISQYYHNPAMFWFYLSRYLLINKDNTLSMALKKYLDSQKRADPLISLMRSYLGVKTALPNPSSPTALCYGFPTASGAPTYCGSKVCTIALAIEQLSYASAQPNAVAMYGLRLRKDASQHFFAKHYPPQNSYASQQLLAALCLHLQIEHQSKEQELFGLLIHYAWLSYNLLDTLIDGEVDAKYSLALQEINLLLMQNLCKLPSKRMQQSVVVQLQKLNSYYQQEVLGKVNYRNYEYIVRRHQPFIWAVEQFVLLSEKVSRRKAKLIASVVGNVLLVRQLADDAHDYVTDIKNGIRTYTTHLCYNQAISQQQFWTKVMPLILADVAKLEMQTEQMLALLGKSTDTYILNNLWQKSVSPFRQADRGIKQTREVLDYFNRH